MLLQCSRGSQLTNSYLKDYYQGRDVYLRYDATDKLLDSLEVRNYSIPSEPRHSFYKRQEMWSTKDQSMIQVKYSYEGAAGEIATISRKFYEQSSGFLWKVCKLDEEQLVPSSVPIDVIDEPSFNSSERKNRLRTIWIFLNSNGLTRRARVIVTKSRPEFHPSSLILYGF